MRERYLKTKEDVRALRDRLNSGKWTIDPYWSFDMKYKISWVDSYGNLHEKINENLEELNGFQEFLFHQGLQSQIEEIKRGSPMTYQALLDNCDDEPQHLRALISARGAKLTDIVDEEFLDVMREEGHEVD